MLRACTGRVEAVHAQQLQDELVMADVQHQQQQAEVVPSLASAGLTMDDLEGGLTGVIFSSESCLQEWNSRLWTRSHRSSAAGMTDIEMVVLD